MFFVDFSREITEKGLKWTKKVEKQLKKCIDQLLGARRYTQQSTLTNAVEVNFYCVFQHALFLCIYLQMFVGSLVLLTVCWFIQLIQFKSNHFSKFLWVHIKKLFLGSLLLFRKYVIFCRSIVEMSKNLHSNSEG